MRYLIALGLFLSSMCLAHPIHLDGSRFRDKDGHQILLRGVNVGGNTKVPPFIAVHSENDLAPLRGWGFNTIRLLFNWEAFEPEPGVYNWAYLDAYRQTVDWAATFELYTIVDVHQDGFSRYSVSGCGEGFPKWALPPTQTPSIPDNGKKCANWGVSMIIDLPMHAAWHHFYANTYGVRDRYKVMLKYLAEKVADAPNVVGFDVLNEPWGNEETELPGFYEEAGQVIRSVSPDAVLFLSPHALTSAGIFPSKLPPISLPNIVHSTHYYDPSLLTVQAWSPWTLEAAVAIWKSLLNRWKTPFFLGEFGASATVPDAADYIATVYDVMDRELYSGAQWVYTPHWNPIDKDGWNEEDFSINDDSGQLRGTFRPRPFVESTPGDLIEMRWTEKDLTLQVVYEPGTSEGDLQLTIPDRLRWIGVNDSRCAWANAHRLRCSPLESQRSTRRTLTFHFQST